MTIFRWLHLTDLHLGAPGQASLWPNMEELFLKDLDYLREQVGTWDLVLFTGDLTQSGKKPEFDALEQLLLRFWKQFAKWKFTPKLFAVPGNHDLVRPTDTSDPTLITLLHNWSLPDVQTPFWENAESLQRRLITEAFHHFTDWWQNTAIPKPEYCQRGCLPGDCAATVCADEYKIGLVGLNSAFLQLGKGNFQEKLHLDVQQLHKACCDNGPAWVQQHDLCLLLTHHPVCWLHGDGQKHFVDEIHAPPERFALHLFGHMHEGNLSTFSQGGGNERRCYQGTSLFSLESWGEEKQQREHGYSLCELRWEDNEVRFRVWPRRVKELQGGGRKFRRDDSFDLDERDGGTRPVIVKCLERGSVTVPVQPSQELPLSNAIASYNPSNPPFNVPYRSKGDQVVGRDTALAQVRKQLTAGRRTAIGQTALFQGLGGLGKTQLAVEYAHRFRDEYPNGIIWLTADQDLEAQLTDLAVKAQWVAPTSDHHIKLEVALHRVRSYSDCLIVFDNLKNLEAIKEYLPELPAKPHILVTSRSEQPDFSYVPVELLDPDQSLRMLVQEAGRQLESETDRAAAREIACQLDGLPLALELAGAYLARRPVAWKEYLDLLRHSLKQALPSRLSSLTGHEADLYSTLQVSESDIAEEPRLREVLDVLTWSGPAAMSRELLANLIGAEDQRELTSALGLGMALRLLQQEEGTNRYSLHRLVREVRREQAPLNKRADWAADLCRRVGDWFEVLREEFIQLTCFEAEVDHLREWHDHALSLASKEASRLTWLQAYPFFHRGRHKEARCLIELAFSEYEEQPYKEPRLLAHLQNDLASMLDKLGETKAALELAEKALTIRRELFGERHPDVAYSLSNIAFYTDALGDPKKALELAEKALSIRRELFGDSHPVVAMTLHNMAGYHWTLGDMHRAYDCAQKAYEINKHILGPQHPDTRRCKALLSGIRRPGFRAVAGGKRAGKKKKR